MDKEKVKARLGEAAAKAKVALSEIKANFKADEGTTGFPKVKSMFVNLWRSGTTGKAALVSASVVSLLLLSVVTGGDDAKHGRTASDATTEEISNKISVPKGTFAVDNLYIGMPDSDALKACLQIVSASNDLGIEDCRPVSEKIADPTNAELIQQAEKDVERFLRWQSWDDGCLYDPNAPGYKGEKADGVLLPRGYDLKSELCDMFPMPSPVKAVDLLSTTYLTEWKLLGNRSGKIEEIVFTNKTDLSDTVEQFGIGQPKRKELFLEKGLTDMGAPVWVRLVLHNGRVAVTKKDIIDFWLGFRAHSINTSFNPQPLIKIGVWEPDGYTDKLKAMCFVWFDDTHKVKEVYYNEDGLTRFFNARGVSAEEFARNLVDGFKEIPDLERNVTTEENENGEIRTCIWTYKDVHKGYQVKFYDRSFRLNNGEEVDFELYSRNPEVAVGLAFLKMLDKHPKRFFSFSR
ncbi:MAG: hypothetical protein IJS08_07115 [Victivallales bacterium]|nr:hypothetical protein [Victivallales bacterium]